MIHRLVKSFKELMNYEFTANMENSLDHIALNQQEWKIVLDTFFDKLSQQLYIAEQDLQDGGMQPNMMVIMTCINCPMCFRKMGIRIASTGIFLSCSGYNLAQQERCKSTINLLPESKIFNMIKGDKEVNVLYACRRCRICRTAMDSYLIDNKHKLYICGNNPLCNGSEIEQGEFIIDNYAKLVVKCEKCGSNMDKLGRFGQNSVCIDDICKNTRKIL